MSKYPIHNDFKSLHNKKPLFIPSLFSLTNKRLKKYLSNIKTPNDVNITPVSITGYNGDEISIKIYTPKHSNPDRALVYCHGGHFAFTEAPYQVKQCIDYAIQTPCKVISVNYHLLPKNVFPAGLEDCYSAVKWVSDHAESLGINPHKIAIGGDDSGATLAAGVTLLAREKKEVDINYQLLIQPVISMKMNTPSMKEYHDTPMWNSKLNKKMWHHYLKNTTDTTFAAPLEMDNHDDLPDAYIEVAEFDCLRDEGIAYATVLERSNSNVELNFTRGTLHKFDIVENSEITIRNKNRRIEALQRHFNALS